MTARVEGDALEVETETELGRLQVTRVAPDDAVERRVGLPLGIIIGLGEKSERWEPVTRPSVGPVALRLVTSGGRGVGLNASIPVGGHSR